MKKYLLVIIGLVLMAATSHAAWRIYYGSAVNHLGQPYGADYKVSLVGWGSYCLTNSSGSFEYRDYNSPSAGYYSVKIENDDGFAISKTQYYFDGTNPADKNLGVVRFNAWQSYN